MFLIYKTAGAFAAPPGIFILLLAIIAALAWAQAVRGGARGKATALSLALLAAALYAASTPAGALLVTGPLEARFGAELPPDGEEAVILVLAGGSSYDGKGSSVQPAPLALERLYNAVMLAKGRGGKSTLLLSGGNVFGDNDRSEAAALGDAARAMGWRGEIILEERSRTTAENMKYSAEIIRDCGVPSVIIVTNAFHMPRSMRLARSFIPYAALHPFPTPRQTDPLIRGAQSFLPDAGSLKLSCIGAREWIGIAASKIY